MAPHITTRRTATITPTTNITETHGPMSEIKHFQFSDGLKRLAYILLGLGVLGVLLTIVVPLLGLGEWNHGSRLWSNILLNNYYFTGMAIVGLFFLASHQLGYSGWQTLFKKVPLAMGRFAVVGLAIAALIVVGMWADLHHLYGHWTHHSDAFTIGKQPFLTKGIYSVSVLGFFGLWALYSYLMGKRFPSITTYREYQKSKYLSATFILIFAVSTSVVSWHYVMSLDPHWYSTLFGWYNFASYACAGFAAMILILIFLKQTGHMPHLSVDHLHDLGKYLFGFSVFWTYLWFSQFMLIWYANIPEATAWYTKRMEVPLFKILMFVALIINFALPLLVLMKRDSKRQLGTLGFVAVMVIIGHYLDFYGMMMFEPNAVPHHAEHADHGDGHDDAHALNFSELEVLYLADAGGHADSHTDEAHDDHAGHDDHADHDGHADGDHHDDAAHAGTHGDDHHDDGHGGHEATHYAKLGLAEIFIFLGFLGGFILVVFSSLNGQVVESTDDPFIKESAHHHI